MQSPNLFDFGNKLWLSFLYAKLYFEICEYAFKVLDCYVTQKYLNIELYNITILVLCLQYSVCY